MKERTTPDRVPQLLVEQLALGELDPERARDVATRLTGEPGGEDRLIALGVDDEATLAAHPPARVATAIEARARIAATQRRSRRPVLTWLAPAVTAAAVAAIALLVVRPSGPGGGSALVGGDPDTLEVTRPKGPTDPRLAVYLEHDEHAERLVPGAAVAPRDRLQLGYIANGASHGVLVSIDGRGAVTLHFPETDADDTALSGDGEVVLPYAYELDDAPGFERFLLVTSDRPLTPADVVDAARRLAATPRGGRTGDLDLPGAHSTSLLLRKVVPR